ncbi:MAG: FAD-dependent oxidoreductase [Deltaproteobacteria bacterium]|nr:FAD-dependent oxidoreductase [Deltaproteobacteria bacterium]
MADMMYPIPFAQMMHWIDTELAQRRSIFGLPEELFFRPDSSDPFRMEQAGAALDTPLGVAAGPQTQLAQNIITAWLAGARFLELKTVQVLDELEVTKPCIDIEDEGYNCEWSQELKLEQSLAEYLKAWIAIHALQQRLGLGESPGFVFNMSVGYNLEGIQGDRVQKFLQGMADATEAQKLMMEQAADRLPDGLDLPNQLSNSITLSTMHGCPPDEIERIGKFLIEELGLHTSIKLNPTLLGPDLLRGILNDELGFSSVVPDAAFEHDPSYEEAVSMVRTLKAAAEAKGVFFGLKLTNTLETLNIRYVLPEKEAMHYMSGRALHPLSVQLAHKLSEEFEGSLPISLSGGADVFNVTSLLAGGLRPVTVCSDLLRPGGYGRLPQYIEEIRKEMTQAQAPGLDALALSRALTSAPKSVASKLQGLSGEARQVVESGDLEAALAKGVELDALLRACQRVNLANYAEAVRKDSRYHKPRRSLSTKTERPLGRFDCIHAPCTEGCPANQNVPDYMHLVSEGKYTEALGVVLKTNPLPATTGAVCDHPCMTKCVRNLYDAPLAIREIKRFITEQVKEGGLPKAAASLGKSAAVVGAGPAGLAASYYLALGGFAVTLFDAREGPGGVPAQMIPSYRLPDASLAEDIARIRKLGVETRFGVRIGEELSFADLQEKHDYVFVGIGAHRSIPLKIENEDAPGVHDCLVLLSQVRSGGQVDLGKRALVVGGGNSAMDAARTARRLVGADGEVIVVYRRTVAQMPADDEEIEALLREGVQVQELLAPTAVRLDAEGRFRALACQKMRLGEADRSGRPKPVPIEGSTFDLEADSLIVAIGQKPDVAMWKEAGLAVSKWDSLQVDEATGQTNLERVFAGGDAVRGGATIIKAEADARLAAVEILQREGRQLFGEQKLTKPESHRQRLLKKSRRVYPEAIPELPDNARMNFERVVLSLGEEQARKEASRCLDCDDYCSLCVTVCPNRANWELSCEPFSASLPALRLESGDWKAKETQVFSVDQDVQIVNLADFCNECGNCATFCPTAGAPYRDKVRLCFSDASFAAEEQGWRIRLTEKGWTMQAKAEDGLHELCFDGGKLNYDSPKLKAELDSGDFSIIKIKKGPKATDGDEMDLVLAASMFVLGRALARDSNCLPI